MLTLPPSEPGGPCACVIDKLLLNLVIPVLCVHVHAIEAQAIDRSSAISSASSRGVTCCIIGASDSCPIGPIFEIREIRWGIFEILREYTGATRPLPLLYFLTHTAASRTSILRSISPVVLWSASFSGRPLFSGRPIWRVSQQVLSHEQLYR